LYYALDKIAYDAGKAAVHHQRFHGFQANTNDSVPNRKKKLPTVMVDEKWRTRTKNEGLVTDNTPLGFAWSDLEVADVELAAEDLAALADWEDADNADEL
jgi:hypothetical protein